MNIYSRHLLRGKKAAGILILSPIQGGGFFKEEKVKWKNLPDE